MTGEEDNRCKNGKVGMGWEGQGDKSDLGEAAEIQGRDLLENSNTWLDQIN